MNLAAFCAPEFSDLMNVSEKEIHAILNAAVLPVLPVLLCRCAAVLLYRCAAVLWCCAALLYKYREILKEILRIPLQIQRDA